jgi:hypothetical protein
MLSRRWLQKTENKPIETIPHNISYLSRFWGLISQFLNEPRLERPNCRKSAKQTQTNPLRLSRLLSKGWLKNSENKPIADNSSSIIRLHRFLASISQFLNEPGLVRPNCQKAAKQTQTNPLRLSLFLSEGWLKNSENKPIALISNNISVLDRFSGSISRFLDETSPTNGISPKKGAAPRLGPEPKQNSAGWIFEFEARGFAPDV